MKEHIYSLDPAAAGTLTEQLTDNLRRAIAKGICKPGDKLPGVRQMAKLCGTSVQVPINALKALAEEGFVKARPRIGCVVLEQNRKVWRGRILIVHVGAYTNYSQNVFCAETARLLGAANWRVEHAFVPRLDLEKYDLSSIRKEISERFDLVLLPAYDPPIVRLVRKSGLPYMLLSAEAGELKEPGCIGITVPADSQALAKFTEYCRMVGISHVLNIRLDECFYGRLDALRSAGITVEDVNLIVEMSDFRAERFAHLAYDAILARFGGKRTDRPDLIVFADDHFARGGLFALERLGLRVPEDVRVVSHSNYGNAPFYPKPLTRFEHDPFEEAEKMVQMILRYFRTGRPPRTVLCNVRYVRGETF